MVAQLDLFIYCASDGSDTNTGSIDMPVKTISRALSLGNKIKLKAGCTFFERIELEKDKTYVFTRYGDGANPIISGLRMVNGSSWVRGTLKDGIWTSSSTGRIWKLDLTRHSSFSGFPTSSNSATNNIGGIYNWYNGKFCGARRVFKLTSLKSTFDFYQPFPLDTNALYSNFNELYVYFPGNLNAFPLALTSGYNGITADPANLSLDGIDVMFWGRHGISIGSNSTVKNCNVFGCGGSLQIFSSNPYACLGNGIEVWVTPAKPAKDILISDCTISTCFDAGITLQGNDTTSTNDNLTSSISTLAQNVRFTNVTVDQCRYGIETFINLSDPDIYTNTDSLIKDSSFSDCIVTAETTTEPAFRRSYPDSTQEEERNWAIRASNKYPIGMKISSCNFRTPDFLIGSLSIDKKI